VTHKTTSSTYYGGGLGGGVTRLGRDPSSPLGLLTDYTGSYPIKDYNCASAEGGPVGCFGDNGRLNPQLFVDLAWNGLQYNAWSFRHVVNILGRFSGVHLTLNDDAEASFREKYFQGDLKGALQNIWKVLFVGTKFEIVGADDWVAEMFPEANPDIKDSAAGSDGAAGYDYKHNDELLGFTNLMLAYTTAVYHFEEGSVDHNGSFIAMPSPEVGKFFATTPRKGQQASANPYDYCDPVENTINYNNDPEYSFNLDFSYFDQLLIAMEEDDSSKPELIEAVRGVKEFCKNKWLAKSREKHGNQDGCQIFNSQASIYEWQRKDEQILTLAFRGSEVPDLTLVGAASAQKGFDAFTKDEIKNNLLEKNGGLEDVVKASLGTMPGVIADWFSTDLNIAPAPDLICPHKAGPSAGKEKGIHIGFQLAYLSIRAKVMEKLNEKLAAMKAANPDKPVKVFVTGHSLAGALTELAAYDISCNDLLEGGKHPLFGSISFGTAPNWFGRAMAEKYQSIVPKEARIRVEACGKVRRGTLPLQPASISCEITQGTCDQEYGTCAKNCASCDHLPDGETHKCWTWCGWGDRACKEKEASCTASERRKKSLKRECEAEKRKCDNENILCKLNPMKIACQTKAVACEKASAFVERLYTRKAGEVATCDAVGAVLPNIDGGGYDNGFMKTTDGGYQAAWVRDDKLGYGKDTMDVMDFGYQNCYGFPRWATCHLLDRYSQGIKRDNKFNGGICSKIEDLDDTKGLTPDPLGGGQDGFPSASSGYESWTGDDLGYVSLFGLTPTDEGESIMSDKKRPSRQRLKMSKFMSKLNSNAAKMFDTDRGCKQACDEDPGCNSIKYSKTTKECILMKQAGKPKETKRRPRGHKYEWSFKVSGV